MGLARSTPAAAKRARSSAGGRKRPSDSREAAGRLTAPEMWPALTPGGSGRWAWYLEEWRGRRTVRCVQCCNRRLLPSRSDHAASASAFLHCTSSRLPSAPAPSLATLPRPHSHPPVCWAGIHNLLPTTVDAAHHVLPPSHCICLQPRLVAGPPSSSRGRLHHESRRCQQARADGCCIQRAAGCLPSRQPAIQQGHPAEEGARVVAVGIMGIGE